MRYTTRFQAIFILVPSLCICFQASLFAGDFVTASPTGGLIAVGQEDGTIDLRNTTDFKREATLNHLEKPPHPASAVNHMPNLAFSPDGKRLASAVGTAPVVLWDVERREKIKTLLTPSVGYDLTFSADGSRLAGIGIDSKGGPHRFTLWDTESGKVVTTRTLDLILGKDSVRKDSVGNDFAKNQFVSVTFLGTKGLLAVGSIEDGKPVLRLLNPITGEPTPVAVSNVGTGFPKELEEAYRKVSEQIEAEALSDFGGRVRRLEGEDERP